MSDKTLKISSVWSICFSLILSATAWGDSVEAVIQLQPQKDVRASAPKLCFQGGVFSEDACTPFAEGHDGDKLNDLKYVQKALPVTCSIFNEGSRSGALSMRAGQPIAFGVSKGYLDSNLSKSSLSQRYEPNGLFTSVLIGKNHKGNRLFCARVSAVKAPISIQEVQAALGLKVTMVRSEPKMNVGLAGLNTNSDRKPALAEE
jgi:hypothetical protein